MCMFHMGLGALPLVGSQAPKLMRDLLFSDTVIQTQALGFAAAEKESLGEACISLRRF